MKCASVSGIYWNTLFHLEFVAFNMEGSDNCVMESRHCMLESEWGNRLVVSPFPEHEILIQLTYPELGWNHCSDNIEKELTLRMCGVGAEETLRWDDVGNRNVILIDFRFSGMAEGLPPSGSLVNMSPKRRIFQTVPVEPREYLNSRYDLK